MAEFDAYAEAVAFDPRASRVATAGIFGTAEVWDLDTESRAATLSGHTGAVNDVAFSPDGSRIATASADGTVRLRDPASGDQQLILRGHEAGVWDLAFSPDGSRLTSSSPDGTVRIWALDVEDLIEIAQANVTRALTDDECQQYLHEPRLPGALTHCFVLDARSWHGQTS